MTKFVRPVTKLGSDEITNFEKSIMCRVTKFGSDEITIFDNSIISSPVTEVRSDEIINFENSIISSPVTQVTFSKLTDGGHNKLNQATSITTRLNLQAT